LYMVSKMAVICCFSTVSKLTSAGCRIPD
jgi:hypothetical protein